MRKPQKDGHTYGEHLEQLVRQGRRDQSVLDGPDIPDAIAYLWQWFGELERTRDVSAHGPRALSYAEIDAWSRLTDRRPQPHEVEALVVLDAVTRHPREVSDGE